MLADVTQFNPPTPPPCSQNGVFTTGLSAALQEYMRLGRVALRERLASQPALQAAAAAGNATEIDRLRREQLTKADVMRLMDSWYLSDGLLLSTTHIRDRTVSIYDTAGSVMVTANMLVLLVVFVLYFVVVRARAHMRAGGVGACARPTGMVGASTIQQLAGHRRHLLLLPPPPLLPRSTAWCWSTWTRRSSARSPCCCSSRRTPSSACPRCACS